MQNYKIMKCLLNFQDDQKILKYTTIFPVLYIYLYIYAYFFPNIKLKEMMKGNLVKAILELFKFEKLNYWYLHA